MKQRCSIHYIFIPYHHV